MARKNRKQSAVVLDDPGDNNATWLPGIDGLVLEWDPATAKGLSKEEASDVADPAKSERDGAVSSITVVQHMIRNGKVKGRILNIAALVKLYDHLRTSSCVDFVKAGSLVAAVEEQK